MALRIQNNIAAMEAQRNLGIANSAVGKSLQRLSSGYRINSASDDAAGLSVSQGLRADIASQKVASRNVSEANSLLQTSEGAMDQIGSMLTRLKELATQASSANASGNLTKINAEGNSLLAEIDRIATTAEYAGTKLLDGSFGVGISATTSTFTAANGLAGASGMQSATLYTVTATIGSAGTHNITISATVGGVQYSETINNVTDATTGTTRDVKFKTLGLTLTLNSGLTAGATAQVSTLGAATGTAADFQVGAKNTADDRIGITLTNNTTASTGLNLSTGQLQTAALAQTFLAAIDTAISTLNTNRGTVGATQNRLGYASATLDTTIQNNTAADSVIRDVDMASEMTSFTKNQILMQAGTAMLAQANSAPQQILSLFK